jgi:DNA polymerase III subunit gamma/tau
MKHAHLTAKYRPQTFAEVAGQDEVRTILSRAAATDRIAPAYLFSGTRGVGKTTLARILAKAINCVQAPAAEPCNQCPRCRQITQGAAVDVVEIDGASNRGIEQARRLKEDIGFAPLECRYKVIIIDEAHMLTREAFNALLKTLEEPPGHATFVLATTEPHKFPATIVSRCQHLTFKRLPQQRLEDHLRKVLTMEGLAFEESAVRLLARRGAGSVRDSMSLLGQVLALGGDTLCEADVRRVLGLAGFETMVRVVEAVADGDGLSLVGTVEELLHQGLDLGFFLRELAAVWRNLFLLRQCGEKGLAVTDLPAEQAAEWQALASRFSLPHLHACLQMTLEGQRRVLTSIEPAQALELLLLNLAYLPQLLPLGSPGTSPPTQGAGGAGRSGSPGQAPSGAPGPQGGRGPVAGAQSHAATPAPTAPTAPEPAPESVPGAGASAAAAHFGTPSEERDWPGFLAHLGQANGASGPKLFGLAGAGGRLDGSVLHIRVPSVILYQELCRDEKRRLLEGKVREYFGPGVTTSLEGPESSGPPTAAELKRRAENDPVVSRVMDGFKAQIVGIRPDCDRSST